MGHGGRPAPAIHTQSGIFERGGPVRREVPRMSVHRLIEFISRVLSAIWRKHLDDADSDPESILAEINSKKRDRISG